MATKTPAGQPTEEKLQSLGAAPAPKDDPLAGAKKAFEQALAKTKAQEEADGTTDEVTIIEQPKKKVAAKPKPELVAEQPKSDELAAIKAELAELKRERAEKKQPKAEPEPEVDHYAAVKAQLSEQFGDEEGEILANALKAINEPRDRRLAQLESFIQTASEKSRAFSAKNIRSRLKDSYSQLKSDEAWEVVKDRAESVMSKHESLDEAYEATVKALYGEAKSGDDPAAEAEEEASRIAASLPTAPSGKTRERKMTSDEKARAIFDHLMDNPEDAAGAKRLARQLKAY
jgi:hypothetical protein